MNALCDCVEKLAAGSPVDTVVHVGPGDPALLDRYLALWPRQVVWIDADAERGLALRAAAAASAAVLTLVDTPIGASAGAARWQRFDLPSFDGPLGLRDTEGMYPGLRLLGSSEVACQAFAPLFASLVAPLPAGARVMLAIDRPGQELSFVESLDAASLARVSSLLLRGCAAPFFEGGCTHDQALAALASRSWRPREASAVAPLWPAALLEFDASLDAVTRRADEAEARCAAQSAVVQRLEAEVARLVAELGERREEALRSEVARQEAVRQAGAVTAAHGDTLARLQSEIARVAAEREAQRSEVARVSAEREVRRVEAESLARQLRDLADARAAVQRESSELASVRDRQSVALDEAYKQIKRLEASVAEADGRHRLLGQELGKAEGQLALLRDLLLKD